MLFATKIGGRQEQGGCAAETLPDEILREL